MSFVIKLGITIAALAVLGWGFVNYSQKQPVPVADQQTADQMQAQKDVMNAASPTPTTAAQAVSARGASDAELDADLKDADTQIQSASQSSASIDQGLNDKSGNVAY